MGNLICQPVVIPFSIALVLFIVFALACLYGLFRLFAEEIKIVLSDSEPYESGGDNDRDNI